MEDDMHTKRVTDAYVLMNDILTSKPITQPTPSLYHHSPRPLSPGQPPKKATHQLEDRPALKRRRFLLSPRTGAGRRGGPAKSGTKRGCGCPVGISPVYDCGTPRKVHFSSSPGEFASLLHANITAQAIVLCHAV